MNRASKVSDNWRFQMAASTNVVSRATNPSEEALKGMSGQTPVQVEEKRGWVRWVLLGAGIAFALPVPFNLFKADFANAAGGAAIAVGGIGGFLVIHRARIARANFIRWLYENADAVKHGNATFEGQPIRPTTTLRMFETAVSMLLLSSKFPSRFIVDEDPAMGRVKFLSTAASLLLGWWGIPFGPVYTVMAVYRNLRGGHVVNVGQMLAEMGR